MRAPSRARPHAALRPRNRRGARQPAFSAMRPSPAPARRYDRGPFPRNRRAAIRRPPQEAAMSQVAEKKRAAAPAKEAAFNWEDPLEFEGELSHEERMVRDTARDYAQDKLAPRVLTAFREERFDREILSEMGALGLLRSTLPEQYR